MQKKCNFLQSPQEPPDINLIFIRCSPYTIMASLLGQVDCHSSLGALLVTLASASHAGRSPCGRTGLRPPPCPAECSISAHTRAQYPPTPSRCGACSFPLGLAAGSPRAITHALAPPWPCGRGALFPPTRRLPRVMAVRFGVARSAGIAAVVVPPLWRVRRAA